MRRAITIIISILIDYLFLSQKSLQIIQDNPAQIFNQQRIYNDNKLLSLLGHH